MDNYDNEEEVLEETEDVEIPLENEEVEVEVEEEEAVEEIDWEARAKKAEATIIKSKAKPKAVATKPVSSTLTTKDLYALIEAKVPESDISDIEEYAQFKGISVTEALQSGTVKTILAQKEEERRVASGTNTGTTRRGTSKVPDDQLMARAVKGEMPETDDDILRYNRVRWGLNK